MSRDPAFERDGFKLIPQVVDGSALNRLRDFFGEGRRVGARLNAAALAPIADLIGRKGAIGQVALTLCDRSPFAVRAILFDKQPETNWSLVWHQDRTINVAERIELAGYGPWTVKQGLLHVQPPQSVIEGMVTLRVHLDDVPDGNGPLRVLPGSHRLGRLPEGDIEALASRTDAFSCLAASGDVWAYRTAIVHASSSVDFGHERRRVLQLDYACANLEPPLQWATKL